MKLKRLKKKYINPITLVSFPIARKKGRVGIPTFVGNTGVTICTAETSR
jgi:hypothetical protein